MGKRMKSVRPTVGRAPGMGETTYDLFLAAVGYEERATSMARQLSGCIQAGIGIRFGVQECLSYEKNLKYFEGQSFVIEDESDDGFEYGIYRMIDRFSTGDVPSDLRPLHIAVDVSCFSSPRLAAIVDAIRKLAIGRRIVADFWYTVAKFSQPKTPEELNIHVGPVISAFAGWTLQPERPLTAIVGMGYEEDKALGAVEHVQATRVWLFEPRSAIDAYAEPLREANSVLLSGVSNDRILGYDVRDPYHAFITLNSLVARSLEDGGCVIFPFGPKIFRLASFLVACINENAAVWRVSPGIHSEPFQRKSAEMHYGLRADFDPTQKVEDDDPSESLAQWL